MWGADCLTNSIMKRSKLCDDLCPPYKIGDGNVGRAGIGAESAFDAIERIEHFDAVAVHALDGFHDENRLEMSRAAINAGSAMDAGFCFLFFGIKKKKNNNE